MAIEDAYQQLTQNEKEVLAKDRERWERMGAGAHLNDWLAYGEGLLLRRQMAMRIAFVNRPEGRGYAEAFAALMRRDGLDSMDKGSMTAVLWLHDNPEHMTVLREIMAGLTPGERSRLNSPKSARERVTAVLKARVAGTEAKLKGSPLAKLKEENADLRRKLAVMEAKAVDGGLFDLRRDDARAIGKVIADTLSEDKAKRIAVAISEALRKGAKPKPAG
jgi:hypothetical protein